MLKKRKCMKTNKVLLVLSLLVGQSALNAMAPTAQEIQAAKVWIQKSPGKYYIHNLNGSPIQVQMKAFTQSTGFGKRDMNVPLQAFLMQNDEVKQTMIAPTTSTCQKFIDNYKADAKRRNSAHSSVSVDVDLEMSKQGM